MANTLASEAFSVVSTQGGATTGKYLQEPGGLVRKGGPSQTWRYCHMNMQGGDKRYLRTYRYTQLRVVHLRSFLPFRLCKYEQIAPLVVWGGLAEHLG